MMQFTRLHEERGGGIDKIKFQMEFCQLPAPFFEVAGEVTGSILFAPRSLARMTLELGDIQEL